MTRLLRLLGAAALAAFLVAACGGGDDDGSTAAPATTTTAAAPTTSAPAGTTSGASPSASEDGGGSDDTATITIKDFRYGEPIKVKPGATVTVVNQDVARHDVVADQNQVFRTELLGRGQSATFTAPTTPGSYTFSCSVHANMTSIGTLVVEK